jgi:hypothetical protein
MRDIVSGVFNDPQDARRAVEWLREEGLPDRAISVVGRGECEGGGRGTESSESQLDEAGAAGAATLAGAGLGAGVGALFGLAAAAIPGVGPFVTAGALAHALGVAGGSAAAGAIVGGTSGALAGAFSRWGLDEAEAQYYADEVHCGATYVGVDLSHARLTHDRVLEAFRRFNGRFSAPAQPLRMAA